jgi:putative ABC transport system permease protein
VPIYQSLKNLTVANGNFITDDDNTDGTMVVVLGFQLAKDAFGTEDPVGKQIKLENNIFTVVGVLADNSQANSRVFMPLKTVMSKIL